MTNSSQPLATLLGVRQAVRNTPAYPFTPTPADIKLDQNESPEDLPTELRSEALKRMQTREWNRYPELHADALRQKIADYEGWDVRGVVLTPGSNVLIKMLTELAGLGQTVLTTQPVFSVYGLEAGLLDAKMVQLPLNADFSLPVEDFVREIKNHAPGLLVITEPHAPTGYLDSEQDIRTVLDAAGEDWVVVLDEAYYQYAGSDFKELIRGHVGRLSLRTFSKAWGLAGLRLGYALTSPELGEHLQKLISAFNINVLTESVVEVALENPAYMQARVAQTVGERERIRAALAGSRCFEVLPSKGNFFLLRSEESGAIFEHLLSRGILVRRQETVLAGCLRVSLGTPEQNDRLIAALREYGAGGR